MKVVDSVGDRKTVNLSKQNAPAAMILSNNDSFLNLQQKFSFRYSGKIKSNQRIIMTCPKKKYTFEF